MSQEVLATGTVVRATDSAVFAVRDVSAVGARLLGPLRLIEGERVTLEVELGGEALVLAAEVLRFDPQRAEATVRFREMPAVARAAIERAIAAMLEVPASRVAIIVHPDPETCAAMQRDLARIGLGSRACGTLLELTWQLDNPEVAGVIVAGSFDADAILRHLEEHHPQLVRVLLCGDTVGQVDHASAARVQAVLRTPWRIKGLARAFGIQPDAVTTTYDQLVALQPDSE